MEEAKVEDKETRKIKMIGVRGYILV